MLTAVADRVSVTNLLRGGMQMNLTAKGELHLKNCNSLIELKGITVKFDNEPILKNIDLHIYDKEFITFLGPSGCGKTTTLRIIAGFVSPDEGDVLFEGKRINDLPAHKRNVNTVFQRYALFPHLNVFENVAFGLRIQKVKEEEVKKRVADVLALVDLKGYEKRKIAKLSGGQQQRVAIARALINQPKVLLLDEPLGALDLKLRKDMQLELKTMHGRLNTTFVYVTHDQEEALTMSDRIVVMNEGKIEQIGPPTDIYNEPLNAFVADFIGESNIIDATMEKDYVVNFCGHDFNCVDPVPWENSFVDVVVRPEDIVITPVISGQIEGVVEQSVFKGVHYEMTVDTNGYKWLVHSTVTQNIGDSVGMTITPENIHIMKKMFPTQNNNIRAEVVGTAENGYMLSIEDSEILYPSKESFEEGNFAELTIPPFSIEIVAENEGDFNGYLESSIYKGWYNEMIIETDSGRKWLVNSTNDEQVATYVGMKLHLETKNEE